MDVKPAQEVNHVSTAIALVAAGMGVAALPAYAVRFTERTRVQAVPLGPPVVERHVSLSTLRQRTLSVATSAMREHLVHFARQTYGA